MKKGQRGEIRDKDIKERGRKNRALRNAIVDDKRRRDRRAKETFSLLATEVDGQPPDYIGVYVRARELYE
jgi:hypothetical protein